MKMRSVVFPLLFLALIVSTSCKKKVTPTAREKQEQLETTQPLLFNEILEQEGIRFTLNYSPAEAEIGLKLYTPEGTNRSEVPLVVIQPNVVYSITAMQLPENSVSVLEVEFKKINVAGKFDLSVVGFTDINANKNFTVKDNAFKTTDQASARKILKITKGIRKISFSGL